MKLILESQATAKTEPSPDNKDKQILNRQYSSKIFIEN